MWRWGLWEVLGLDEVRRVGPCDGINILITRRRRGEIPVLSLSVLPAHTQKAASIRQEERLRQELTCQHLDLGLARLKNCEK